MTESPRGAGPQPPPVPRWVKVSGLIAVVLLVLLIVILDLVAATARASSSLRAAYVGMGWVAGGVIVPLAVAALLTGILVSLITKWGLLRHYWVVISLVL